MPTAGIVIDDWKEDIFAQGLSKAGFSYTIHPGVVPECRTIKVLYEKPQIFELTALIKDLNKKALMSKAN